MSVAQDISEAPSLQSDPEAQEFAFPGARDQSAKQQLTNHAEYQPLNSIPMVVTTAESTESGHGTKTKPLWEEDPRNARNFSKSDKVLIMAMASMTSFVATICSSVISPAAPFIAKDFNVSEIESYLPLSLYVFALAFGPVVGGPLSETVGRMPVYYVLFPAGTIFTLGAGFVGSFGGLCILRFLAGFCWAPTLAVAVGLISDTFAPKSRGPMLAIFILMPFFGPGLGPVLGAYATTRHGWRWTQWVIEFFSIPCLVLIAFTKETFPATIKRRIAKECGEHIPPTPALTSTIKTFARISLIRPVHMLLTEPIVTFVCLYVAVNFGILFSLYAAIPYAMELIYGFNTEQANLVFFSVVIGSLLGFITVFICDAKFYQPQLRYNCLNKALPEYRLPAAMIGSFGLPLGLFWYAWTAKPDISWASPVLAILPFSWGNLCVFVSTGQYMTDIYAGSVVASATSANTLARYAFGGAFPLFIVQMFRQMGIDWAVSLFGFVSLVLLPIPWVLFKYGERIRARSKYDTV